MSGNTIYYLSEYNWEPAIVIRYCRKNVKIRDYHGNERTVPFEKIANPDEKVCVVWEQWKGKNGRGGYRVEKTLYPQYRLSADNVARQDDSVFHGRVWETAYGVLNPQQP